MSITSMDTTQFFKSTITLLITADRWKIRPHGQTISLLCFLLPDSEFLLLATVVLVFAGCVEMTVGVVDVTVGVVVFSETRSG